ncbi:nicotinate (nicotinamide) nucleotide adenylyltransferase [Desulfovibrio litoralis]|uniref:Probable nicotinate-nucleotide adenylyltransferase n=1 Tax=Desulfovibrio litoralis DSM 11393 TaxID=1121455 RepID=A0A1M7SBB0_9BACT|nr:nicotinate (nicotinamide) nucleotide adenylyltransferase [Desulfovibrio litoralis]SHN55532.1 nicotinate-nucleotide adenylyltransferase [Desulfovibrio litoralis DSM 11393]
MNPNNNKLVALLGGSFNPPHLGHLRLGLEILEILQPLRLDFLPVAHPAHKEAKELLPFELRYKMLETFCQYDSRIYINPLENKRREKSYTYKTLELYRKENPDVEPVFILGGEDYAQIQTWEEWERLPSLAHFIIISRATAKKECFINNSLRFWKGSKPIDLSSKQNVLGSGDSSLNVKADHAFKTQQGGEIWHLSLPRLDISATMLRKAWLENKKLFGLIHDNNLKLLQEHASLVAGRWIS